MKIPHGHRNDCDMFKMEQEVTALKRQNAKLRERLVKEHLPANYESWEKVWQHRLELEKQNAELRECLQRIWDEDECGWIIDENGHKECVKCGAKIHLNEPHAEHCTQGFIDKALAAQPEGGAK